MPMPALPIFKRPNEQIANVIRNEATPDYQRHVPVATQANLAETFNAIMQNAAYRNHFESALVNKVAMQIVRDTSWTNPLAKFKRDPLEYGATIEEIQVGLLNAYAHDDGADYGDAAIWSREFPRVDVAYHTINRYDKYKITIPEQALRGAFLNGTGLASFAAQLMSVPTTSDARDEYLVMRNLFKQYGDADGFYDMQVPDLSLIESTPEQARSTLRQLRAMAGKLTFLSDRYNAAHMPSSARAEDLELFITPEANAALDVDALSAAFNVDRAEFGSRTTLIDEFPDDPGTLAVLTTRDFFIVADQINQTAQIQNPANLTMQHFYHHSQVVSASRFVPAIRLTSNPAREEITVQDTATVTLSPLTVTNRLGETVETVERDTSYRVAGHGIAADGEFQTATILTIEGGNSDLTLVTQTGSLNIGADEDADTLTLRQVAADNGIEQTLDLSVEGDIVYLWPRAQIVADTDGDTLGEVEPAEPNAYDGFVTIPNVRGVQYQVGGVNVVNGTRHAVPVTVSAVARSGFELTGDDGPWSFTADAE